MSELASIWAIKDRQGQCSFLCLKHKIIITGCIRHQDMQCGLYRQCKDALGYIKKRKRYCDIKPKIKNKRTPKKNNKPCLSPEETQSRGTWTIQWKLEEEYE